MYGDESIASLNHRIQDRSLEPKDLSLIFFSYKTNLSCRTIGTSLLSVFKARRPLKPERKKRDQVRGAALGDQNVRLIVHIARAFHVPVRQESSPAAPGMQGRCALGFGILQWLDYLRPEQVLKTSKIRKDGR